MKGSFNKTTRGIRKKLREILLVPALHWVKSMSIRFGRRDLPVLVYQVGKVGSSSVYYSLKAAGVRCVHVHRIAPENVAKVAEERRTRGLSVRKERIGLALYYRLARSAETVRIVTMVREPISRNISAFFENLGDYYGGISIDSISVDEAVRRFLDEYPHHLPLEWFDSEFARVTGVRPYAYSFPFSEQWLVLEEGRFKILVLRVEAPDEVKREALRSFLGLNALELVRANVGEAKDYALLYEEFRRKVRLPEAYVDWLLGSEYAQHFYSPEELAATRVSWVRPFEGGSVSCGGDE